jgi:hypothetical protein
MNKSKNLEPESEPGLVAIDWANPCGCFERHLQRRHVNPLFPKGRRQICAGELTEARARDQADLRQLEIDFAQVAKRITEECAQTPGPCLTLGRFYRFIEMLDTIAVRAAEVGNIAHRLRDCVGEIRDRYCESIRALRDDLPEDAQQHMDSFFPARELKQRISENPFLAQMQRADTPIPPREVLPSVLTEPLTTVRLFASLIPEAKRTELQFQSLAHALVTEVQREGYTVQDAQQKLLALEVTPRNRGFTTKVF